MAAFAIVIVMTIEAHVPLAEVKAHLSEIIARVHAQHERVTVTVHGRPSAVLLAVEDLESLEETVSLLADSEAMSALVASEAELAAGERVTEQELRTTLAGRRLPAS